MINLKKLILREENKIDKEVTNIENDYEKYKGKKDDNNDIEILISCSRRSKQVEIK